MEKMDYETLTAYKDVRHRMEQMDDMARDTVRDALASNGIKSIDPYFEEQFERIRGILAEMSEVMDRITKEAE